MEVSWGPDSITIYPNEDYDTGGVIRDLGRYFIHNYILMFENQVFLKHYLKDQGNADSDPPSQEHLALTILGAPFEDIPQSFKEQILSRREYDSDPEFGNEIREVIKAKAKKFMRVWGLNEKDAIEAAELYLMDKAARFAIYLDVCSEPFHIFLRSYLSHMRSSIEDERKHAAVISGMTATTYDHQQGKDLTDLLYCENLLLRATEEDLPGLLMVLAGKFPKLFRGEIITKELDESGNGVFELANKTVKILSPGLFILNLSPAIINYLFGVGEPTLLVPEDALEDFNKLIIMGNTCDTQMPGEPVIDFESRFKIFSKSWKEGMRGVGDISLTQEEKDLMDEICSNISENRMPVKYIKNVDQKRGYIIEMLAPPTPLEVDPLNFRKFFDIVFSSNREIESFREDIFNQPPPKDLSGGSISQGPPKTLVIGRVPAGTLPGSPTAAASSQGPPEKLVPVPPKFKLPVLPKILVPQKVAAAADSSQGPPKILVPQKVAAAADSSQGPPKILVPQKVAAAASSSQGPPKILVPQKVAAAADSSQGPPKILVPQKVAAAASSSQGPPKILVPQKVAAAASSSQGPPKTIVPQKVAAAASSSQGPPKTIVPQKVAAAASSSQGPPKILVPQKVAAAADSSQDLSEERGLRKMVHEYFAFEISSSLNSMRSDAHLSFSFGAKDKETLRKIVDQTIDRINGAVRNSFEEY
jgi:hypothetical protein